MKAVRALTLLLLISLVCVSTARGQDTSATNPAVVPPNLLLLVRQEIQYGKASARQRLEVAMSLECNRIDVPYSWIELQSLSGPREALFFDPFDSFDQMEESIAVWKKIYAAHPELARMQEQIDSLLASEESIVAVRRDDLGYLADHIDLSAARFMRVVEVRLLPGHENDFVEGARILADAYDKIRTDTPWVVYQVKMGTQSSTFLVFMPMPELRQNDELLLAEGDLRIAEGEEAARRLQQISREAYISTSSNLYAVSTEMSHMAKDTEPGDAYSGTSNSHVGSNREGAVETPTPNTGKAKRKATASKTSGKTQK